MRVHKVIPNNHGNFDIRDSQLRPKFCIVNGDITTGLSLGSRRIAICHALLTGVILCLHLSGIFSNIWGLSRLKVLPVSRRASTGIPNTSTKINSGALDLGLLG